MAEKIVVTGATSMIGVALIENSLKDKNIKTIYAVVREKTTKISRLPKDDRVKIIYCNNNEYEKLKEMIGEKCDLFYHMAWSRTLTYSEGYEDIMQKCDDVKGTLNAVKAASDLGCYKFIGAGTQAEYGLCKEKKMAPDTICTPVRADGVLHLTAGKLAKILCNNMNIKFVWMRIFSVYGVLDRENSMISSTINKLLKKEHCSFTLSEQIWDYLFADDIGEAFYLVGVKETKNSIYCVGSGEGKKLAEYIKIIGNVVDPTAKLGIGELEYPKSPIMNLCADITTLTEDTGWKPKTAFEDGIRIIMDSKKAK